MRKSFLWFGGGDSCSNEIAIKSTEFEESVKAAIGAFNSAKKEFISIKESVLKQRVRQCTVCGAYTESNECHNEETQIVGISHLLYYAVTYSSNLYYTGHSEVVNNLKKDANVTSALTVDRFVEVATVAIKSKHVKLIKMFDWKWLLSLAKGPSGHIHLPQAVKDGYLQYVLSLFKAIKDSAMEKSNDDRQFSQLSTIKTLIPLLLPREGQEGWCDIIEEIDGVGFAEELMLFDTASKNTAINKEIRQILVKHVGILWSPKEFKKDTDHYHQRYFELAKYIYKTKMFTSRVKLWFRKMSVVPCFAKAMNECIRQHKDKIIENKSIKHKEKRFQLNAIQSMFSARVSNSAWGRTLESEQVYLQEAAYSSVDKMRIVVQKRPWSYCFNGNNEFDCGRSSCFSFIRGETRYRQLSTESDHDSDDESNDPNTSFSF